MTRPCSPAFQVRWVGRRAARARGAGLVVARENTHDALVPTLSDLVVRHTALDAADLDWLHSLVSDWQLLADLSFADLILWAPLGRRAAAGSRSRRCGPTTGPTVYHDDIVGTVAAKGERPLIDTAWNERRICREGDPDWSTGVPVREETIPVRRRSRGRGVLGGDPALHQPVLGPHPVPAGAHLPAERLATWRRWWPRGASRSPATEPILVRSPRVGDGLLRLDRAGRVTYASPERAVGLPAARAARRPGRRRARPGDRDAVLLRRADQRGPDDRGQRAGAKETEVESGGTIVQLRAIPLIVGGGRIGALVLIRDVTELRRRERELMTKDATIREIHHRVKNNLQTVAALLRLQARRLQVPEGREALEEAVRRVGSIAIVHETLSHAPEEFVDFDDIADRVIAMAGEVSAAEAEVMPRRIGGFGVLPVADRHAAGDGADRAAAERAPARPARTAAAGGGRAAAPRRLQRDRLGRRPGLPDGLRPGSSTSLGLQIVRTLVVGELSGRLDDRASSGGRHGGRRSPSRYPPPDGVPLSMGRACRRPVTCGRRGHDPGGRPAAYGLMEPAMPAVRSASSGSSCVRRRRGRGHGRCGA